MTESPQRREREQIVALSRSLFDRGFSVGSAGNVSVRTEGGYLITPTDSSLGRLEPERISLLDADWNHVSGDQPSKEVFMHRAAYEARPGAGAVVHLHSPYATAWSCLPEAVSPGLPAITPYFVMRLGGAVPVIPYHRPGDPEVYDAILDAAREHPAVLLANHGSVVAGDSLVSAVNAAEELEVTAQLALLLEGRSPRVLTPEQIAELRPGA